MNKRILISNDDGFDARGLKVLEQALTPLGDVFVVAPDSEQSASSHSLTLTLESYLARRTCSTCGIGRLGASPG